MSEKATVTASTIPVSGRYIIDAEGNIFVSDSAAGMETPTVAPEPMHYLLSALAVCALGSVEQAAREMAVKVPGGTAQVTSIRHATDPTRFEDILVDVVLSGVNQDTAEAMVAHFTGHCPIYNTVKRGGPINVKVSVTP
jgi:uncharacterized OsmC-like protein